MSIKAIVPSGNAPGVLLAWRRPAPTAPPATAVVEPLQAPRVCGVMARQGRCVAEAGVRDAAARDRMQHAEA